MTATLRDSLCNLRPMEIPRPKFTGMQFVATRGRYGFYQSISKRGGEKYGIQIKLQGPRRPSLPEPWRSSIVETPDQDQVRMDSEAKNAEDVKMSIDDNKNEAEKDNSFFRLGHDQAEILLFRDLSGKKVMGNPGNPEKIIAAGRVILEELVEVAEPEPDYPDHDDQGTNTRIGIKIDGASGIAIPIPNKAPPPAPPLPKNLFTKRDQRFVRVKKPPLSSSLNRLKIHHGKEAN